MKSDTQSEVRYVAAPAADRAPVIPVLNNPLVALAAALINPLLGLFRRENPAEVENNNQKHASRRAVSVRAHTRSAPAGRTAARKGGRSHG